MWTSGVQFDNLQIIKLYLHIYTCHTRNVKHYATDGYVGLGIYAEGKQASRFVPNTQWWQYEVAEVQLHPFLPPHLIEVRVQIHIPAAVLPTKAPHRRPGYSLNSKLDNAHRWPARFEENENRLPLPRFELQFLNCPDRPLLTMSTMLPTLLLYHWTNVNMVIGYFPSNIQSLAVLYSWTPWRTLMCITEAYLWVNMPVHWQHIPEFKLSH
jgi:hypothetical protein